MKYQEKLKNATTIEKVQEIYNEEFKKMIAEIEEESMSESNGQQLVYDDGYIDPSLTMADIHLLIHAKNRVKQLSKNNENKITIKSNHDSFVDKRLEELRKKGDKR